MLAIISDIHDNIANLKKVLAYCKKEKIKNLLCAGDITNSETLSFLSENFSGNIWLSGGNAELYKESELEEFTNIHFVGRQGGFLQIQEKNIGLCHEPYLIDDLIEKFSDLDIVFYGHTHRPWEDKKDNIRLVNPGNIAGTLYQASFAIYNPKTDELKLKILDEM